MSIELSNGRGAVADTRTEIQRRDMRDIETMAKHAANSRMFGMDAAQAFTLMLIAQSEGLDPIQALKRYHVIQGRPAMRADAMQAEFQRQGGTVEWIETTDTGCKAIFRHPHHCPKGQLVEFTAKDAERAQLLGKENWRKYPASMYRARVISMGVRMVLPGVVVGIYTPEEVSDSSPDIPVEAVVIERPSGPSLIHEPTNEPQSQTVSPAKQFLREAIQSINDRLYNTLLIEHKEAQFKPVANEFQLVNHLISKWIADGALDAKDILKPDGKRDRAKLGAAVQVAWHQDAAEIKRDVWSYLVGKARELAIAAEVDLPEEDWLPPWGSDDDSTQAMADDDPPALLTSEERSEA